MAAKRRKVEQKYAVNITSLKAWDLAKAGAGIKLRVRDRGKFARNGRDRAGHVRLEERQGEMRIQADILA